MDAERVNASTLHHIAQYATENASSSCRWRRCFERRCVALAWLAWRYPSKTLQNIQDLRFLQRSLRNATPHSGSKGLLFFFLSADVAFVSRISHLAVSESVALPNKIAVAVAPTRPAAIVHIAVVYPRAFRIAKAPTVVAPAAQAVHATAVSTIVVAHRLAFPPTVAAITCVLAQIVVARTCVVMIFPRAVVALAAAEVCR